MGRDLFAPVEQPANAGRDVLSRKTTETMQEKAIRLGATPGVALTQEQIAAIQRGERIDGGKAQLQPMDYQEVPRGEGNAFVESAIQESKNIGAGVLRAGGELINSLGFAGARTFLDELEASQAIDQKQTEQATEGHPVQSFFGGATGGTLTFPVGGGGTSLLTRLVSGAAAGATGGGLSAAGRGEDAAGIAEEAAIGGVFGGVAEGAPKIIQARQAKKAQDAIGNAKLDIEDLSEVISNVNKSQKATQKTGIGLLPGQQTGDLYQSQMTAFLGENPEVSRKAYKTLTKQNKQAAEAVNKLLNKIATPEQFSSAPGMGRKYSKEIVNNARKARSDVTAPMYKNAFRQATETGFKPDISAVKGTIDNILEEAFDSSASGSPIQSAINKVKKVIGDSPTLRQLQVARFSIDDMLEGSKDTPIGSNTKRYLTEIRENVTDALREFEPFAAADNEFSRLSPDVDKVKEGVFGRIQDLADKDLRRVSKIIFDQGEINNADTVRNSIKSLKGVTGGEEAARGLLRVQLEDRLGKLPNSIDEMISSGTIENVPAKLRTAIFGNDKQQKMLFAALDEIDPKAAKNALWLKTALDKARTARPGGSQTGIRAVITDDLKSMGVAGAIAEFIKKPISNTLEMGKQGAYNEKVRAIGDALYNLDWAPDMNKLKKLDPNSAEARSGFEKLLAKIARVNAGGTRTQAIATGGRLSQQEQEQK